MPTVLCRLPNHVGDCCMCLPALRLLEASGYTPALVGKRWAEDLMAGMGWRFDPITGHVTEDIKRIRYLAQNANATKGLLFPNSLGSALLFKFGQIESAGLTTDCRSLLLSTKISEPPKCHEVERFFHVAHEAIKAWGSVPAWDKVPQSLGLHLLKRHEAAAKNLMEKYGIPKRYAVLAPVARGLQDGQNKSWAHFNDLVKPLRDHGVEPIIFPNKEEAEAAKRACPDASIFEPTTLGNFAAIVKHSQLVVANDSGVSHIAAAVGAKCITLVGVTDPVRTAPWSTDAVILGKKDQWPTIGEVISALTKLISH